jgi:ABC-type nitrate/sulfonate/bicarbonate transport system substrate-binding protein
MRAVLRAITYAKSHSEESARMLAEWIKVDRELASKSFEIGSHSWPDSAVASDVSIKNVVDQSLAETKTSAPVSLDRVRDWSFAERAKKDLERGPK